MSGTNPLPPQLGAADDMPGDWTEDRRELLCFLEENAPLLAMIYAAAVAIIDFETVPGRSFLVWHAIREIRNRLPEALSGVSSERFDSTKVVSRISARWRELGLTAPCRSRCSPLEHVPFAGS